MASKLRVKNLYKVFGAEPQRALDMLQRGAGKDEIFAETGQTVGVQDVDFDVPEGTIFVVMGLSGSGKSTLVRMLNGLIKPTSGQVLIDGDDVASCSDETLRSIRRNKIAMVFQHFALFPHKTVADNVAYGLKIKGVGRDEQRQRALRSLEQVGLAAYADSYPSELSGGMQQRVGLARGLATEPQVLLMDEPFGALDPLIRRDMQAELLELQRTLKKTIIFITHDLNEALILGDQIAIMKDGSFVQVGTADEIVGAPADDYVTAFTQDIDRSRVFAIDTIAAEPASVDVAASPTEAMDRMEELGRDTLFVTDAGGIVGVVRYRDLAKVSRTGGELRTVIQHSYATIARDAQLHEVYEKASSGLPVAVLDEKDAFVGVVDPHAVFAQLVRGEGESATAAAERRTLV